MEIKEFKYSANFCEENIWHLCQNQALEHFSKKVLIVSNENRYCPFRYQKSINGDDIVWWNYHVILLATNSESTLIYDFDSTLPIPLSGLEYLQRSFQINGNQLDFNLPYFKAIDSEVYLSSFFSDRSHMKDSAGNWLSTPPKWPLIANEGGLELPGLLNFTATSKEKIYSLDEMFALVEAFG